MPIYICPACLFLGERSTLSKKEPLYCSACDNRINTTKNIGIIGLSKIFVSHTKRGIKCPHCKRFIPESIEVICPYPDCSFLGTKDQCKRMYHPSLNIEVPAKNIPDKSDNSLISLIRESIKGQQSLLIYKSYEFALEQKNCIYQAFLNLLSADLIKYLLFSTHNGFQHKLFQEYIRLLEAKLPIAYRKYGKVCRIESLAEMSIFDGISSFEAVVDSNGCIKNNTKEMYIGGRESSIVAPYYIGKLLSVEANNQFLMDKIVEYSFSKIMVKDIDAGTKVRVKHLRIAPHYQMGSMALINRIKKEIAIEAKRIAHEFFSEPLPLAPEDCQTTPQIAPIAD